jgi:hypothetical protein
MKNNVLLEYKWRNYILQEIGIPLPQAATKTVTNVAKEAPEAAKISTDVATNIDYNKIVSEVGKLLTASGLSQIAIESIKAKILKGLPETIKQVRQEKRISFVNGTKFVADFLEMIRELIELAQQFRVPVGQYLERFFTLTEAGTFAGEALSGIGVLLLAYDLYEWLAGVGREFKKSSGSFATQYLRDIEQRIKEEGFAKVKRDIAWTSTQQMQIFSKLKDAQTLNSYAPVHFPTVVDLLPDDLQKHFRDKKPKNTGFSDAVKYAPKSTVQLGRSTTDPESRNYRGPIRK